MLVYVFVNHCILFLIHILHSSPTFLELGLYNFVIYSPFYSQQNPKLPFSIWLIWQGCPKPVLETHLLQMKWISSKDC